MPLTSTVSKERLERQNQLLATLEAKCADCEELKGMKSDNEYIYFVHDQHPDGPAMLAYAVYNKCKTYAVYVSEELADERLGIFSYFMSNVKKYAEPDEQIIVFSQRDYDAINKSNYGNPIMNVKLHV